MTTIIHQPGPDEKEYRCTLPGLYPRPADGHKDPSKRQGHYIKAGSAEEAREKMLQRFPTAKTVDVELWKPGKGVKAWKRNGPTGRHTATASPPDSWCRMDPPTRSAT